MRVTAFHAQTERKRQDRSARCAEKHHRRARPRWLQRRICPVPRACAPADTARGQKLLASEQTQASTSTADHLVGIARARLKIGMQNLAYNVRRLVTLERMANA